MDAPANQPQSRREFYRQAQVVRRQPSAAREAARRAAAEEYVVSDGEYQVLRNVLRTRVRSPGSEDQHRQVRQPMQRKDLDQLAEVLQAELSNEDLPVPLAFEIELESLNAVRIEIALPDLDDIPTTRTVVTKPGKVAYKTIGHRAGVELYENLCAGLVLRTIYEVFRVLLSAQRIEVFGTADATDPATGSKGEAVVLHLNTTREAFETVVLDQDDASPILAELGRKWSLGRSGDFTPLDGVRGLGD